MLNSADPDSGSDDLGHPTTTPLPEYAGEFPDTDTIGMAAQERLERVTKALLQLVVEEPWIGALSLLPLDGFED